jgi:sulfur-carrier protein
MATVIFNGRLAALAGVDAAKIEALTVRDLVGKLEKAYPGLAGQLTVGMAVAIDGDIISTPWLEKLDADSEVCFIPAIEGG